MATPQNTFVDLGRGDYSRLTRALDKRAHLALVRESQDVPAEAVEILTADFGHVTSATNRMLTRSRGAFRFRHFIDTLIGVAAEKVGGRVEWFDATDKELAAAAGRSKKWVQEMRREFIPWQKKRGNFAYADIEDHKYTEGEATKPHRYRVHLSAAAAAATLDAYTSPDFETSPGHALRSAADTFAETLPQTATHKKHGRNRPADAETEIHRRLRAATTSIKSAVRMMDATGGNVEVQLDTLAALKAEVEALERKIAVQHGEVWDSNKNIKILPQSDGIDRGGGVELSATPPPRNPAPSARAQTVSSPPIVHSKRDIDGWNNTFANLGGKARAVAPSPNPTPADDGELTYELDPIEAAGDDTAALASRAGARFEEARGAPVRAGRAIWRSEDGEMPVTVTGEGKPYKGGARSAAVVEVSTGRVPLDEIKWIE